MHSAAHEIRTRDKVTKVLSHFFRCVCFRFGDTGLAWYGQVMELPPKEEAAVVSWGAFRKDIFSIWCSFGISVIGSGNRSCLLLFSACAVYMFQRPSHFVVVYICWFVWIFQMRRTSQRIQCNVSLRLVHAKYFWIGCSSFNDGYYALPPKSSVGCVSIDPFVVSDNVFSIVWMKTMWQCESSRFTFSPKTLAKRT